jgi:hypothetical protein
MFKMRVLLALFLIVLSVLSHTVLSFRAGGIIPNKKAVLVSSWMKSHPNNDAYTIHTGCSSVYHLPKIVSRTSLSFARSPLVSGVHAYDRLQNREQRSQRLRVISPVHIESDPQQMSNYADIMKAMDLLLSVTNTGKALLAESAGELEPPLLPSIPLKELITLDPALLPNSIEAKNEENECKELAMGREQSTLERRTKRRHFCNSQYDRRFIMRHMISPEILMSRIQALLHCYNLFIHCNLVDWHSFTMTRKHSNAWKARHQHQRHTIQTKTKRQQFETY